MHLVRHSTRRLIIMYLVNGTAIPIDPNTRALMDEA